MAIDKKSVETIDNSKLRQPRIMRRPEILNLTGLSRSTIYRLINSGDFPQPVSLGLRSVGWHSEDVYSFIASLEVANG